MATTYKGKTYNDRHGGPFDRGSADSFYRRGRRPHYFTGDSFFSTEIPILEKGSKEYNEYMAGYDYNEELNHHKDYV